MGIFPKETQTPTAKKIVRTGTATTFSWLSKLLYTAPFLHTLHR